MKKLLILAVVFAATIFSARTASAQGEDLFSSLDTALPIVEGLNPGEEDFRAAAALAGDPDLNIRDFYRRRRPASNVKIPEPVDGERLMWKLDEVIRNLNIPIGNYSVIRVRDRSEGFHIRFIGKIYSDGRHASVTEATNEIMPGDLIVKENFEAVRIPPVSGDGGLVAKQTEALGDVSAFLEPDEDEKFVFAGTRQLIGAKFSEYRGGNSVSIGGRFSIRRNGEEIAKAVVIDADLDLATLYVYESKREVHASDEIFSQ